jgi:hypothetical protein
MTVYCCTRVRPQAFDAASRGLKIGGWIATAMMGIVTLVSFAVRRLGKPFLAHQEKDINSC